MPDITLLVSTCTEPWSCCPPSSPPPPSLAVISPRCSHSVLCPILSALSSLWTSHPELATHICTTQLPFGRHCHLSQSHSSGVLSSGTSALAPHSLPWTVNPSHPHHSGSFCWLPPFTRSLPGPGSFPPCLTVLTLMPASTPRQGLVSPTPLCPALRPAPHPVILT